MNLLKNSSPLPQHHRILWNDGPRLRKLDEMLAEKGLSPTEMGKGRNVWCCWLRFTSGAQSLLRHDCDIVTYDRSLLARLIYQLLAPGFNYVFGKGYYTHITGQKMNGRVSGCWPFRALKKVYGSLGFLECWTTSATHFPVNFLARR